MNYTLLNLPWCPLPDGPANRDIARGNYGGVQGRRSLDGRAGLQSDHRVFFSYHLIPYLGVSAV